MPEEGFLRRWARVKASGGDAVAEAPPRPASAPAAPAPAPAAKPQPPAAPADAVADSAAGAPAQQSALTLDDAAKLTPASDFSAFVSQGVDKDVRRLALKKLFSDPHFNVLDRLDMYMDDYNKPDPVSAAMLAGLQHARSALRRPEEVQAELARMAALEPPPHPGGVAQPMPVRALPEEAAAPAVAAAQADAEPGPDAAAPVPDGQVATDDSAATLPDQEPRRAAEAYAIEHSSGKDSGKDSGNYSGKDSAPVAPAIVRVHNEKVGPEVGHEVGQ
jgi:hypothetical protein